MHSRIIEGDSEDTNLKDLVITARLLVDSSQIGCVLGKGGTIITQLRQDTGASIRILSSNEKPLCASPCDELVQVGGGPETAHCLGISAGALLSFNIKPPCVRPCGKLVEVDVVAR